jgi:hypothetical protein
MSSSDEYDAATAQYLLAAWKALKNGNINFHKSLQHHVDELLSATLTSIGLVDTRSLSEETLRFARIFGATISTKEDNSTKVNISSTSASTHELQVDLFRLFRKLFSALTGRSFELISTEGEIRDLMMWRVKHQPDTFEESTRTATDELGDFYNKNSLEMFRKAKQFGGMRLVTGGQRTFGPSALSAVRTTGLYADTQLIPDPVYPFLHSNLKLNAAPLQLAIQLFHILQLSPLVDAELPVLPVFVFPSFEEALELGDAHTKIGMERMVIRLIAPLCQGTIITLDDLFEYSVKNEDAFLNSLMPSALFVPPGKQPNPQLSATEAANLYIKALEGFRSSTELEKMKGMPIGLLLLQGIIERLRPQYHLFDNARELGAQPLLSQPVHWHYFEKISEANAKELRSKEVISEQAFQTLRAVQDDSLSWLASIPVSTLSDLIRNNEHRWLREELNKYTTQLASLEHIDTSAMIREVRHGLDSLVQRQHKNLKDIERKYSPKKAGVYVGGAAGVGLAASAMMLPSLSPLLGISVPAIALAAVVSGTVIGYSKEKIGEAVEKRQAERSILGVLATVRPRE